MLVYTLKNLNKSIFFFGGQSNKMHQNVTSFIFCHRKNFLIFDLFQFFFFLKKSLAVLEKLVINKSFFFLIIENMLVKKRIYNHILKFNYGINLLLNVNKKNKLKSYALANNLVNLKKSNLFEKNLNFYLIIFKFLKRRGIFKTKMFKRFIMFLKNDLKLKNKQTNIQSLKKKATFIKYEILLGSTLELVKKIDFFFSFKNKNNKSIGFLNLRRILYKKDLSFFLNKLSNKFYDVFDCFFVVNTKNLHLNEFFILYNFFVIKFLGSFKKLNIVLLFYFLTKIFYFNVKNLKLKNLVLLKLSQNLKFFKNTNFLISKIKFIRRVFFNLYEGIVSYKNNVLKKFILLNRWIFFFKTRKLNINYKKVNQLKVIVFNLKKELYFLYNFSKLLKLTLLDATTKNKEYVLSNLVKYNKNANIVSLFSNLTRKGYIYLWESSWLNGVITNFYGLKKTYKSYNKDFLRMKQLPDIAVFFTAEKKETVLNELSSFLLPMFGFTNIEMNPFLFHYYIPANVNARDALYFYFRLVLEALFRGYLKFIFLNK